MSDLIELLSKADARVQRLEDELKATEIERDSWKSQAESWKNEYTTLYNSRALGRYLENMWDSVWCEYGFAKSIGFSLLALFITLVLTGIFGSGEVKHCHVEETTECAPRDEHGHCQKSNLYSKLVGVRQFRPNVDIATFNDVNSALAAAEKMHCEIK